MTSEIGERLKMAREQAGFASAAEAARRFGWAVSTYAGHENGGRGLRTNVARKYAKAFRVKAEWLLLGEGPMRPGMSDDEMLVAGMAGMGDLPALPGTDLVPVYNVEASAGHGAVIDHEEIVDTLAFPPGYLRRLTKANPRHLAIIGVKGESMVPTLQDDDIVMIDTMKRDLSFDGLFVIRDNGAGLLVKRVGRASQRGHVTLISDNRHYPPTEKRVDEIEVIGRVIWMGKKV